MAGPIVRQRKFPGNIGNGASREAAVNIKKKINRIGVALIFHTLKSLAVFWQTEVKCLVIFNKRYC